MQDRQLPSLPPGLRFERRGDLLVGHAGRKVFRLPVTHLRAGTAGLVRGVVASRPPAVIVAPRFTRLAKEELARPGWGWIDHDGNLRLETDGVLVHIERPRPQAGSRAPLLVPPQGERVVRHLLDTYPSRSRWTEIARATSLDKGYTSRILRRLEEHGLVARQRGKPVDVPFPAELFEAWQAGASRATETAWAIDLALPLAWKRLLEVADPGGLAFTGVFAAAILTGIQDPDRIEAYVPDLVTARRYAGALRAAEVDRGANLILLIHRDPGVIKIGIRTEEELPFVSFAQAYRDALQRARGREREAADALRRQRLSW